LNRERTFEHIAMFLGPRERDAAIKGLRILARACDAAAQTQEIGYYRQALYSMTRALDKDADVIERSESEPK